MIEKGYTIKVLDNGYVRYIDNLGTDKRIVESARVSYGSPSKGDEQDKKLLEYLYKNHHSSPLEQCSITFNIKLPLFVQAQLVRHRMARLNQRSYRYSEAPDDFYIPKIWRKQDVKNKQGSTNEVFEPEIKTNFELSRGNEFVSKTFSDYCEQTLQVYKSMINSGVSREMARMILPQNIYTEIYFNIDLNNLTKLLTLRLDEHAQWEIRQYAQAMYEIFKELYPWTAEAFDKYRI